VVDWEPSLLSGCFENIGGDASIVAWKAGGTNEDVADDADEMDAEDDENRREP